MSEVSYSVGTPPRRPDSLGESLTMTCQAPSGDATCWMQVLWPEVRVRGRPRWCRTLANLPAPSRRSWRSLPATPRRTRADARDPAPAAGRSEPFAEAREWRAGSSFHDLAAIAKFERELGDRSARAKGHPRRNLSHRSVPVGLPGLGASHAGRVGRVAAPVQGVAPPPPRATRRWRSSLHRARSSGVGDRRRSPRRRSAPV